MENSLLNSKNISQTFRKMNTLKKSNNNLRNISNTNTYLPTEVPSLKRQQIIKTNKNIFPSRKHSNTSPFSSRRKILDIKSIETPQTYNISFQNKYCATPYHIIKNKNKNIKQRSFDYSNSNNSYINQENNSNYNFNRGKSKIISSLITQPYQSLQNNIVYSIDCSNNNNIPKISDIIKNYSNNSTEQKSKNRFVYNNTYNDLYYNLNQIKNENLCTISVNTNHRKFTQRSNKETKTNLYDILDNNTNKIYSQRYTTSQSRIGKNRNNLKEQIHENRTSKIINTKLLTQLNSEKKNESEKLKNIQNENVELKKQIKNLINNLSILKKQNLYFKNQLEISRKNNSENNEIINQLKTENDQLKNVKIKYDTVLSEYLIQLKNVETLNEENNEIKNNNFLLEAKIKASNNNNLKLSTQINELLNRNKMLLNKNEKLLKSKQLNRKTRNNFKNNFMNIQKQQNFFFSSDITKDKYYIENIRKNKQLLNIIQQFKNSENNETEKRKINANKNLQQYLVNHFEIFYNNSVILNKKDDNSSAAKLKKDYKDLKIKYDDLNNKYNKTAEKNKLLTSTIKEIKTVNHSTENNLINQIIDIKKQNQELLKYKEQSENNKINQNNIDDNIKKKLKKKSKSKIYFNDNRQENNTKIQNYLSEISALQNYIKDLEKKLNLDQKINNLENLLKTKQELIKSLSDQIKEYQSKCDEIIFGKSNYEKEEQISMLINEVKAIRKRLMNFIKFNGRIQNFDEFIEIFGEIKEIVSKNGNKSIVEKINHLIKIYKHNDDVYWNQLVQEIFGVYKEANFNINIEDDSLSENKNFKNNIIIDIETNSNNNSNIDENFDSARGSNNAIYDTDSNAA